MSALDHQPYGDHYIRYKMQPVELTVACKWDFIQGNIAKYVLRSKYKNGDADLEKAMHYCEIGSDMTLEKRGHEITDNRAIINHFVKINELPQKAAVFFILVNEGNYELLKNYLSDTERIKNIFW